jgi:uncharacterized protein (DUF2236 family)
LHELPYDEEVNEAVTPSEEAAGFFGPDSVTWRVDREMALFLGGPRSLLLQIAHPAVAAAVEEHSDFRVDPLGRLNRTLNAVFMMVFGDRQAALDAAARVVRRHGPVRGVIDEASASPWSGKAYHAQDPELLLWVHATLVDTSLFVYERVVGKLERRDAERYYEESCIVGELLGLPRTVVPKTLGDFEEYFREMVEGPTLHVGRIARAQKDDLERLEPSYGFTSIYGAEWGKRWGRAIDRKPVRRLYGSVLRLVAAGMLPARVRDAYGYRWERRDRLAYDALLRSVRLTVPRVPERLRFLPSYRWACERALRSRA